MVFCRIKLNFLEQTLQLVVATLDVSNQVSGHILGLLFARITRALKQYFYLH